MDNGIYDAMIINHELRTKNSKDYIHFMVDVEDGFSQKREQWPIKVWLTSDGAIKRARATLRRIGFDMDTPAGISPLIDDPKHLAGLPVQVEITDNPPYGQQCNIMLDDDKPMEKGKAASISAKLKSYAMDNEKPIATPKRSNAGQAMQAATAPPADKFSKENIAAASQQAKDDQEGIPF